MTARSYDSPVIASGVSVPAWAGVAPQGSGAPSPAWMQVLGPAQAGAGMLVASPTTSDQRLYYCIGRSLVDALSTDRYRYLAYP